MSRLIVEANDPNPRYWKIKLVVTPSIYKIIFIVGTMALILGILATIIITLRCKEKREDERENKIFFQGKF